MQVPKHIVVRLEISGNSSSQLEKSITMPGRTRYVGLDVRSAQISPEAACSRFARATAILLRIANRLEDGNSAQINDN